MEWLLLAAIVLVTAAFVAHGLRAPGEELPEPPGTAREALEERRRLLAELAEIDAGTAAGSLSAEERRERRRALAPRLRAATEELRASGWLPQSETRALPETASARDGGA